MMNNLQEMISILFFYSLIFLISSIIPLNRKYRYLTLSLVMFQMSLLIITLKNIIVITFTNTGISIYFFFLVINISLLVSLLGKLLKKQAKPNTISQVVSGIWAEIVINLNNLVYFNIGSYYFIYKMLVVVEKKVRQTITKPQKVLCITFGFYGIVLFSTILEVVFFSKIYFSLGFFFFFLFLYRISFLFLQIIQKVLKNSVNYNFREITWNLFFEYEPKDENDYLFIFLHNQNINDFVFFDSNTSQEHLLEKYEILVSIVTFSRNWLLIKIFTSYYFPRLKIIFTFHLIITVITLVLVKHFFFIWCPVFFDILGCYFVITCVVYEKITNDPRFFLTLLIKNLGTIPKFFEKLKTFYQTSQYVTSEINKKEPRAIYVKFNPYWPGFLESFLKLPLDYEDDDILKRNYKALIKTFVLVMLLIFLICYLNYNLNGVQKYLFWYFGEFFMHFQSLIPPIWNILKFIFLSTCDYILPIFPKNTK